MECKNLFAALAKAQGQIKSAPKSGENTYDHYKYATLEDYYEVIRGAAATNGLFVMFSVGEPKQSTRKVNSGKEEYYVLVKVSACVGHESGESMTVESYGEGQDRGDKAVYKAITGAKKYLLSNIFAVPMGDDAEKDSHDTPEPEKTGANQNPPRNPGNPPPRPPAPAPAKLPAKTASARKAAPAGPERVFYDKERVLHLNEKYQAEHGLINEKQWRAIVEVAEKAKIDKNIMKTWLYMAYGVESSYDIKPEFYEEILAVLVEDPDIIRNYQAQNQDGVK